MDCVEHMLQVTNIEKSYGKQVLFDGVSFTVNRASASASSAGTATGKRRSFA